MNKTSAPAQGFTASGHFDHLAYPLLFSLSESGELMKHRTISTRVLLPSLLLSLLTPAIAFAWSEAGPSRGHVASIFGSVHNDFTTYLDVTPSQRPESATQHWMQRYRLSREQLNDISRMYAHPPAHLKKTKQRLHGVTFRAVGNGSPLSLANTKQGAYVGELIPGMDIGVAKSYGLPGGSWVRITDSQGRPVGRNGGFFRVADRGDDHSLKSQGRGGGIDFYAGADEALSKELHKGGQSISVTPVSLSAEEKAKIKQLAMQNGKASEDHLAPGPSQSTQSSQAGGASLPTRRAEPVQKRPIVRRAERVQRSPEIRRAEPVNHCELVNEENRPSIGDFFARLFKRRGLAQTEVRAPVISETQ
ncbi:hypothetical protein EBZ37_05700 [bacterium]|nr:hypothetical protein [bacterium]